MSRIDNAIRTITDSPVRDLLTLVEVNTGEARRITRALRDQLDILDEVLIDVKIVARSIDDVGEEVDEFLVLEVERARDAIHGTELVLDHLVSGVTMRGLQALEGRERVLLREIELIDGALTAEKQRLRYLM